MLGSMTPVDDKQILSRNCKPSSLNQLDLDNPLNARSQTELKHAQQERERCRIEALSHIGKVPLMFSSPTFSRSLREMHELSESPRRHRLILEHAVSKLARNNKFPTPFPATVSKPITRIRSARKDSADNYKTPVFTGKNVEDDI